VGLGHPQQISTGFVSWLCYCSDVVHQRPTKLCTMFGRLLGCYTIYTFFGGSCPLREFCHVQTSLCVQVLRSLILAALLHSTRPVSASQTLRRGTRNGKLSQTAPPIFGWAAITLGIGPHSSFFTHVHNSLSYRTCEILLYCVLSSFFMDSKFFRLLVCWLSRNIKSQQFNPVHSAQSVIIQQIMPVSYFRFCLFHMDINLSMMAALRKASISTS